MHDLEVRDLRLKFIATGIGDLRVVKHDPPKIVQAAQMLKAAVRHL